MATTSLRLRPPYGARARDMKERQKKVRGIRARPHSYISTNSVPVQSYYDNWVGPCLGHVEKSRQLQLDLSMGAYHIHLRSLPESGAYSAAILASK